MSTNRFRLNLEPLSELVLPSTTTGQPPDTSGSTTPAVVMPPPHRDNRNR